MKDFLINYRKENNLTQTDLAKKLGLTQQTISRLEKNKINPSLGFVKENLKKLGYKIKIEKTEE